MSECDTVTPYTVRQKKETETAPLSLATSVGRHRVVLAQPIQCKKTGPRHTGVSDSPEAIHVRYTSSSHQRSTCQEVLKGSERAAPHHARAVLPIVTPIWRVSPGACPSGRRAASQPPTLPEHLRRRNRIVILDPLEMKSRRCSAYRSYSTAWHRSSFRSH